ncbi:MAG: hypothetical protein HWE39_11575 [Oceanospirillaceae bacterium]|nr:hypothetical protein [Oceanospirillaceae bacterium]
MDPKRRFLLKGMLASGAGSALLGGAGLAQAALDLDGRAPVPLVLLTACADVEASFGAGVWAALPRGGALSVLHGEGAGLLAEVTPLLGGGRKLRLVGMVDDATGELLVAQARRQGARMRWLGLHAADRRESRHSVVNGQGGQSALLALGEQLRQSSAGFALKSEQPFSRARDLSLAGLQNGALSADWAVHLGHALAAPGAPVDAAILPAAGARLQGRFVSFVIEV